MHHLIESIKILDGRIHLPDLHNERLNRSRRTLLGETVAPIYLEDQIRIPENCREGLFKCRVLYSMGIDQIEFVPYKLPVIRTLRVVAGEPEYAHKYADRRALNDLYAQRGDCDDILILKNGEFTDSWFANLVFDDGRHLWTPERPLLEGVKRAFYLQEGRIRPARITPEDLARFQAVHLINAMLDLEDCRVGMGEVF